MKKRHEQKLIILSVGLLIAFSIPVSLLFNSEREIFGYPADSRLLIRSLDDFHPNFFYCNHKKIWMSSFALFIVVLIYLALVFLVAHLAEKKKSKLWISSPYHLRIVSCCILHRMDTYYGSIGVAATSGANCLPGTSDPSWLFHHGFTLMQES
ncbi:hypothetical protein [Chryseobacterium indoltheticum]|uniref:hypothetical protein n=1 Tax=Chryseobacterium indoltheticum TaxID=254 RepID=UPI003F4942B0